jgi:phage terminase small subunit
MRDLTSRQERFCQLFIELGNATKAHKQAGYGQNMSKKGSSTLQVELRRLSPEGRH